MTRRYALPRVECPACGRQVAWYRNGHVARHQELVWNEQKDRNDLTGDVCPGSGQEVAG